MNSKDKQALIQLDGKKWNLLNISSFHLTLLIGLSVLSFLQACSLPSPSAGSDGEAFVVSTLNNLKPNWDTSRLELDPRADKKTVSRGLKQNANLLGPIKKIGLVERGHYRAFAGIGMPDYVGAYRSTLICRKGKAVITITAEHLNGKWLVQNINIDSNLFKNLGKKDRVAALAFAGTFIKKWSEKGFAFEMLYQNADPECAKELHNQDVPAKIMFAMMQKMGKVKKLSGTKLQQLIPVDGGFIFSVAERGDFKDLRADMVLSVVKQDGQWKVHNFQIHSKNFNATLLQ